MRPIVLLTACALSLSACGAAQCDDFVAQIETCYDDHCGSSDSRFCECWNDGMDLNIGDCECIARDLEAACDLVDLPATLDCATASSGVDNVCN